MSCLVEISMRKSNLRFDGAVEGRVMILVDKRLSEVVAIHATK